MPEFLRDPAWQFVGALITLLALFVSILIYRAGKNRKALSYEFLSRTPLLSMEDEIKGKLQILFEGEPVSKVYLVVLRLTNTGNTPIVSSDYERDVSFLLENSTRILTAEISETNPENLTASLEVSDNKISMKPVLLNKGDSVTIKALLGEFFGTINADCRIVGVKKIEIRKDNYIRSLVILLVGSGITLFGFGFFVKSLPEEPPLPTEALPFIIIIIVGYVISTLAMLSQRRYRKMFINIFRNILSFFG
jgi:hypothetical protein